MNILKGDKEKIKGRLAYLEKEYERTCRSESRRELARDRDTQVRNHAEVADSYHWSSHREPESVTTLSKAGISTEAGIGTSSPKKIAHPISPEDVISSQQIPKSVVNSLKTPEVVTNNEPQPCIKEADGVAKKLVANPTRQVLLPPMFICMSGFIS